MKICQYFLEFLVFGCLGWVYECIYCMLRDHRWQNRGFLFGPICPIYGFCIVAGDIIIQLIYRYTGMSVSDMPIIPLFLACMVGSAVTEYVTSYVLEKRFHARWWDYSDIPFNLQGRISLPTSVGFGIMGTAIAKLLYVHILSFFGSIPTPVAEAAALAGMGILAADIALTEANLHDLLERIMDIEDKINVHMESTYQRLEDIKREIAAAEKAHMETYRNNITFYHRNIINNIRSMRSDRRDAILLRLKDDIKQRIEHRGR